MVNELDTLMERWENALNSYGTPGNFADSVSISLCSNPANPNDIPLRVLISPGFLARKKFMEIQKAEAEKRKIHNSPKRWANDGASCFLCDNVGQAKDIGNNILLPWESFSNYALLPNRYPLMRGHFLFCAKNHDLTDKLPDLKYDYISTAIELSQKYDLLFLRNHPGAGMNIPHHEHAHFHPAHLKDNLGLLLSLNGLSSSDLVSSSFGPPFYSLKRTRFGTIALKGRKAIECTINLADKLNKKSIIFTFAYDPDKTSSSSEHGIFFLTPHKKNGLNTGVASKDALYFCIAKSEQEISGYKDFIKPSMEHIYEREKFDWKQFIEE